MKIVENKNSLSHSYGFKNSQDKVFPPMVFAETTNICNLNCIHCPYSYISEQKSYKPRHMEFNIFKKIVDEVSSYKGVILRLVCDGEPMLHPQFLDMIDYAVQKGISPICLNTNGTLLNERVSRELLKNVDSIEISLDAINKYTYEFLRKGAIFEKTMSGVFELIALKEKLKAKTKIMVSIIDQPEVKEEMEGFIKFWSPKVDRVIKRAYTSIGGLVDKAKLKAEEGRERWPCPLLWKRIFVNVDGLIKFCVEDWLDNTVISHINDKTIKETWISAEYAQLRNSHLSGDFQKVPYCKECIDWPARKWDYDYFYALNQILNKSQGNGSN